jgi:hypothetical protein
MLISLLRMIMILILILGGTEYFQKAQLIVTNAQSAAESGWKSFESQKQQILDC